MIVEACAIPFKMDFSDSSDNEEENSKVPRVTALDSESSN